ncbi:hypothetical protein SAMN02982931_03625 [Bauldia litoralis]|uniref:Uncharacterized protein n=1 Tax=Bauldia litoralis TaxID=665467 RepID=A0A1G6DQE7_9HYPH|nr:hypothetical protein SAMN02982931_03625 [Bauldia litoralis]
MVAIAYGIPSRQPVTLGTMNGTETIGALSVGLDSRDDGEVKLAARRRPLATSGALRAALVAVAGQP